MGTTITLDAVASGCAAPEYQFWISPPNNTWGIVQPFSPSQSYVWNTTGAAGGDYWLSVWVRQTGSAANFEWATTISYTLTGPMACTGATITPNLASPQQVGTVLTFSATATGCPPPEYQFWVYSVPTSWVIVQPYSAATTYNWNTAGLSSADYFVAVWARQSGSAASFEYAATAPYTLLTPASCTAPTIAFSPDAPRQPGTLVTVTGGAATCSSPRFKYEIQPPGGVWTMVQDYSAGAFTWNTAGLAPGTYWLAVRVRQNGSAADPEASAGWTYTLQGPMPCTSATLTINPVSPQQPGVVVSVNASATGCPVAEYLFKLYSPGVGGGAPGWTDVQGYGPQSSYSWNTAGRPYGAYYFRVFVRQSGTQVEVDASAYSDAYVLQSTNACSSVTLTTTPASPQYPGVSVNASSTASGCTQPQYQFQRYAPNVGWVVVQAYSAINVYTWNTTSFAPGTYYLSVQARQSLSTSPAEATKYSDPYQLQVQYACTNATLSATPGSPQSLGTSVSLYGGASTCGAPRYQFLIAPPNSGWITVQSYSATPSYTWNTTGWAAGTYWLMVEVKDSSSPNPYDAYLTVADVVQNVVATTY